MESDHQILLAREVIVERAFRKFHAREHVVHRERGRAAGGQNFARDFQNGGFSLRDLRLLSCDHRLYGS